MMPQTRRTFLIVATCTANQDKCLALVNKHLKSAQLQPTPPPPTTTTAPYGSSAQNNIDNNTSLPTFINLVISTLHSSEPAAAAAIIEALHQALDRAFMPSDLGGYGFPISANNASNNELTPSQERDLLFLVSAYLEAVESEARAQNRPDPLDNRPGGRRGMTMSEKIFAAHDITRRGEVRPGDIIQVDVDWVLASELSWASMDGVYESVGRPGIYRNDRFWLAGDHRVEPELYHTPKVKKLMATSDRAKEEFKMTEFQGYNYTILHTEFVRERAQPGMLCIGADSHTCSAGAVSCLSIGMGVVDVAMPLLTGQTWFTVPKTVNIHLVGRPSFGIGGKDVILYILGRFKRNTIAAERIVEFTGPGIRYLSCDARFAIANMCTEFGAVTGIFEADEQTYDFVQKRRLAKHRSSAMYFRPDEDAQYDSTHVVDLAEVEPFVARFPSPDDVVPVSQVAATELDGVFIGACTTAEEDLIMAALVLRTGLSRGMKPSPGGRRVVVPGSKPIQHKLQKLGLLDVFAQAGFKVRVPGCSMCIGQGVDQAADGEVWLSSQNRNFANRMGPGSIANLSSAATVAASSFDLKIADPRPLLDAIDEVLLKQCFGPELQQRPDTLNAGSSIQYVEPFGNLDQANEAAQDLGADLYSENKQRNSDGADTVDMRGRVLRVGDFIDTDAIIPSAFLAGNVTNQDFGAHCMEYFMPDFRSKVASGQTIVVGGEAFGCGSSRDVAVNALLGAGVRCVIAKSFSFIYARNQPNIGLLGITLADEKFHSLATDGKDITVSLQERRITCGGQNFPFQLSDMEMSLIEAGGLTEAFRKFGRRVFDVLCRPRRVASKAVATDIESLRA